MSKLDSLSRRQFLAGFGGAAVAVAGLGLVGCGGSGSSDSGASASVSGTVNCSGATSFQGLVESAAQQFEDEYPDVTVAITGGGSGQGLSDVKDGKAQIGRSDVFAEEKLDASDAANLVDNTVAVVGMGPIVNSNVDVDDLTLDQLKGIFTGSITDWSEVGGSISYLAFSYFDDTKFKALKVGGVEPTAENVCSGKFTIWAYEHMYTAKDAGEATQAFIDYMLSDAVQGSLVEEEGFIPASDMKVQKDAAGNLSSK